MCLNTYNAVLLLHFTFIKNINYLGSLTINKNMHFEKVEMKNFYLLKIVFNFGIEGEKCFF